MVGEFSPEKKLERDAERGGGEVREGRRDLLKEKLGLVERGVGLEIGKADVCFQKFVI